MTRKSDSSYFVLLRNQILQMIPPKKIKNIARALLLPQKQDLVCASFNESELAVWDLRCHPAGMGGLYEIPRSGKDQDRCLDMLQASGRKMRGVC